ncbi:MAG: IS1 family transposase [Bacteroidetes bacterium]|nr:IS1 family transposase [Bacteroidota bacterium]
MNCKHCNAPCIKKGYSKRTQRYQCKACRRYQQQQYKYRLCQKEDEQTILKLNNIGVGISGIARFTGISKTHILNRIKQIASKLTKPVIVEQEQEYEVDELYTYIGRKDNPYYVVYAINKTTRQVIDMIVGKRTKETLRQVIESIKLLRPKKIYTDHLNIYAGLMDRSIHCQNAYQINHIERFNLTLRTHLKRLSRRTICFSRSVVMLQNVLTLYCYTWKIKHQF